MEQGWDPEVKKFFRKIISTVTWGLIWMMAAAAAGIYFKLGEYDAANPLPTYIFYAVLIISFLLLLRFFYRTWK
jgi:hypothetical protein